MKKISVIKLGYLYAGKKGFTLIELMIVTAIIGLMAALAIPSYMRYQCRAKQTDAKTNLAALQISQESYMAEYNRYVKCGTTEECGGILSWGPQGGLNIYSYSVPKADHKSFTGLAKGKIGGKDDEWTVNEKRIIENPKNACQ